MISVVRYRDNLRGIWDDFCRNAKNPLFIFERNFMEYHKDRFLDHSLLFYDDDEVIAILPMNESSDELFSHAGLTYGGFITNGKMKQHTMNECMEVLILYAREKGFKGITYKAIPHIYHVQPAEEDRYALFLNNAEIIKMEPATVVKLSHPLKMPKGRKAQISRAKREGVEVRILTDKKDFDQFMDLENRVLGKYHDAHAVHSGNEMYLLYSLFPEAIHLYGAFQQEELIAGAIIYEYGQLIHTTYLAASDVARTNGALDLTISAMLNDYKDKKIWFDFGISSENGGRLMNLGLIAQKEGFGGRTNIYDTWRIQVK